MLTDLSGLLFLFERPAYIRIDCISYPYFYIEYKNIPLPVQNYLNRPIYYKIPITLIHPGNIGYFVLIMEKIMSIYQLNIWRKFRGTPLRCWWTLTETSTDTACNSSSYCEFCDSLHERLVSWEAWPYYFIMEKIMPIYQLNIWRKYFI